jgi:hypothetical protein
MVNVVDFSGSRNGAQAWVYITSKDIIDLRPKVEINWSSCGAVSIEAAKEFAKLLAAAIERAERENLI